MNQYHIKFKANRYIRTEQRYSSSEVSLYLEATNTDEVLEYVYDNYRGVTNVYTEFVRECPEKE